METVGSETRLGQLLRWCEEQQASDLHGCAGKPFTIRQQGRLETVPSSVASPPSEDTLYSLIREAFSAGVASRIDRRLEVDLSFTCGQTRYRANFSKQLGQPAFAFRAVPRHLLQLADLQLPQSLVELLNHPRGLILVTGPTGQGKSTTLRALLQEINNSKALRVITIEDPIEFVFQDHQCRFEQREVGIDTASFADGIRNAMRQDPNVIFVGEIRDRESIFAAMQAAETGHLVLTTLHADSVPQAIGRLREYYPASEQDGLSSLLSRNLNSILCQRLVPNTAGGRTPCLEILRRTAGVREAIQTNDLSLLAGIIESAVGEGMHSFDQYLMELLAAGVVDRQTAMHYAVNRHKLELSLRGISTRHGILRPDPNR
jgi:twitching motility protein PilT